MRPLKIDYSIVTVSRPVNYIDKLIAQLPKDEFKRVFVGSLETGYLANLQAEPSFSLRVPTAAEGKVLKALSVFQRATWNYWRALACIPDSDERDGILVLEDDVLPASGWLEHFRTSLSAVMSAESPGYILGLYSSRRHAATKGDKPYTTYPTHLFAGTQAIYYPEQIRHNFAAFLQEHGVKMNEAPYDMLLAEFAARNSIPIFLTIPVLVQHIGKISTGLGEFHEAPGFQPELPAVPSPFANPMPDRHRKI